MPPIVSHHRQDKVAESMTEHSGQKPSKSKTKSAKKSNQSEPQTWDQMVISGCISPPPAFKSSFFTRSSIQARSDSISPTPSLNSNDSNKHSESSKSDSGVSSERDSPSPQDPDSLTPKDFESDDDDRSNISGDSLHGNMASTNEDDPFRSYEENIYENQAFHQQKAMASSRSTSRSSTSSGRSHESYPNPLLRQICERALQFKERRQNASVRAVDTTQPLNLLRGLSVRRSSPSSKLHHSTSFSSSSSSLLSSSVFSSTSSLYEEDTFEELPTQPPRPMSVCEEEPPHLDLVEVAEAPGSSVTFAGIDDIFGPPQKNTIRSQKGTVRGVRNRVRAGIATFTSDQRLLKIFKERERGTIVVYVTNLGIVRNTYDRCLNIKKILWNLSVKFEERDVFMSRDTQLQLLDRLHSRVVSLPHIFIEGQYLGGADLIEHLNETGELKRLLKKYRVPGMSTSPCDSCGGYRMLPCPVCNGSKKSLNRNHFTQEFVALKCCCCDEAGLVRCEECRT